MNRQKSFENNKPCIYLVATPIGNLEEISYRAIRAVSYTHLLWFIING